MKIYAHQSNVLFLSLCKRLFAVVFKTRTSRLNATESVNVRTNIDRRRGEHSNLNDNRHGTRYIHTTNTSMDVISFVLSRMISCQVCQRENRIDPSPTNDIEISD
jgi:hypothetical protein